MKNFLIAYTGREGSSAIVNLLGKQTGVVVPLFEDLDRQNFQEFFEPDQIAAVLDYVYSTGRYDPADIRRVLSDKKSGFDRRDESPRSMIGFKWRPFEEEKAAASLRRHSVIVCYLCRGDFLELVCSLYITSSTEFLRHFSLDSGERHPQFRMRRMTTAEREKFLSELDDLRIRADQGLFLRRAEQVLRSRGRLARRLRTFQDEGVTVRTIYYEEFLESNERFIARFLASLGSPREQITGETRFTKVMRQPATDKIINLPELCSTVEFESISRQYAAIPGEFEPLLGGVSTASQTEAGCADNRSSQQHEPR